MSRASDEAAASKRRASDNAAAKKRRSDRIAIGLCPHCGKPAEAGKKKEKSCQIIGKSWMTPFLS
jgi:hypothetical protein